MERCKRCGDEREFLDNGGVCMFCVSFSKGINHGVVTEGMPMAEMDFGSVKDIDK